MGRFVIVIGEEPSFGAYFSNTTKGISFVVG